MSQAKEPDAGYDYPDKEWWTIDSESVSGFTQYSNMYTFFDSLGAVDRGWSIDDFVNSELGEGVLKGLLHWLKYPDEMCREVLDHWAENGVRKELHNAGDPENKWASYVPLSAYKAENAGKRYPLMFCFRGGNDPIYAAEAFGVVQYGAEAEYITVIPFNRDPDAIQALLDEIAAQYPIDASRVYITGNSMGGMQSIANALANPATFAGIAPFGIAPMVQLYRIAKTEDEIAAQVETFRLVKMPLMDLEAVKAVKMPLIDLYGHQDCFKSFPLAMGSIHGTQDKVDALNTWLEINHIVAEPLELGVSEGIVLNSDEMISRQTGIKFPATWVEERDGTEYCFGEFYDADGVNLMRIVVAMNCNHWHGPSYPEIIWDYLKHFSRNLETGAIVLQ